MSYRAQAERLVQAQTQTQSALTDRGPVDTLPPETLQFAHRMFDAARSGDLVLLQAVDAGLPVNLTNDEGAWAGCHQKHPSGNTSY